MKKVKFFKIAMDIFTALFSILFKSLIDKENKPNENIIMLGGKKMKIKCPKCAEEIYIDHLQKNEKEKTVNCTQCNNNFIVKKNINEE